MNLHTAQTELRSKAPEIAPRALAVEAVVVISLGYMLVGFFA